MADDREGLPEVLYEEIADAFMVVRLTSGIEEEIARVERDRGLPVTVDPVRTYERGLEALFDRYGGETVGKALYHMRMPMSRKVLP